MSSPLSSGTPIQAFHLDMCFTQYRTDYLSSLFSRLRAAGYNTILFEIQDKVRLDSVGKAAWCDAYSKEEFSSILGACRDAGLKAIPLIQTYAHLEWLLTHAPFHAMREQASIAYTLCPLKNESQSFLRRFIDEVSELFDHPEFIHLGGDEATYMGTCPACASIVEKEGKGALYARHMAQIAAYAVKRGSRPLLWADMILGYPDHIRDFPPEVVWVDWHYQMTPEGPEKTYIWGEKNKPSPKETSAAFRKVYGSYAFQSSDTRYRPWFYADYLLEQGFDVLLASASRCAGDHAFLPSYDRAVNVASAALKLQSQPRLLGQIVTSWSIRMHPLEAQWPLLHLPSAIGSQPGTGAWETAWDRACQYSDISPASTFTQSWKALGQSFWWAESHHGIRWESGYFGQPDAIPQQFTHRLNTGQLNLSDEIEAVQTLLSAYAQAAKEPDMSLHHGSSESLSTKAWKLGTNAIQLRAQEYLTYLHAQNGQLNKKQATELLQIIEAHIDQWEEFLLHIHRPTTVLQMQTLLYGETRRLLPQIAWGRF